MDLFTDSTGTWQLNDVVASAPFSACDSDIPTLGLSRSVHWLRTEVRNSSGEPYLYLSFAYPGIDELDVYAVSGNDIRQIAKAGQSRNDRSNIDLLFELDLEPGSSTMIYLRLRGYKHIHAPVTIGTTAAINKGITGRYLAFGTYLGIMLVLFLYNLFVYSSTKDRNYLFYLMSIVILTCTQLSLQGHGPFNYIDISGWLTSRAGLIFNLLAIPLGYEFARRFINTAKYVPRMDKAVKFIYLVLAVIGIIYLAKDPWLGQELGNSISGIAAFYLLTMGIISFRKGSRQAGFFLLAWTAFLLGVIVFVLKDEGVLPYGTITVLAMPIGSAVEGILLSFGLADRINILRREKEQSQAEALKISTENEKIIREQNIVLEEKVRQRTFALQESNEHLKRTQTQLVNAEKMASLGQLTAGIAHEINNPINFITSNIHPLKRNIGEIVDAINDHMNIDPEKAGEQLKELRVKADRMGLNESIEELDGIIKSIAEGSARTAEIVRGLRNFSRLDEADLKDSDLNEGIRNTLTVLAPQFRDRVKLELALGDLPKVECYPGKVNQVFMNILTNAIHATAARTGDHDPAVRVSTEVTGEHVVIVIQDNGIGMNDEVKSRIFDPFFTTKPVGEGTGLGMAIVYGIVQDHRGEILVESTPGVGTEFKVILPIRHLQLNERRA
jgi:signal transduction histidine kinase